MFMNQMAIVKERQTGFFFVCELKNYFSEHWLFESEQNKPSEINLLRKTTHHNFLFSFLLLEMLKEFIK